MAASASPLSSPRLPSPPPIAEDQLGPKSPSPGTEEQQKLFSTLDNGASRRIRPGTKAEDMAEGPPLVDLSEIDSAFQLTEHLKALHNFLTHPIGTDSTIPVDRETAYKLSHPPENVDKTLWLYELCRFLTQKVNAIVIALFSDNPPCSIATCPEMRASEWQYLCAVHDPPKSCGAIDYSCHTLDWAANTLTSPKNFPSRLAMGPDQTTQHQQIRNLTNIFRRVYRIFAHAWFQHRDVFWKVEGRTGLYVFFKTVCDVYGLIPEDNYTIPPEAEGVEISEEPKQVQTPLILKREPSGSGPLGDNSSGTESGHNLTTPGTSTTKRHRASPTVSSISVSTVVEENEEDEDAPSKPAAAKESKKEAAPASPSKPAAPSTEPEHPSSEAESAESKSEEDAAAADNDDDDNDEAAESNPHPTSSTSEPPTNPPSDPTEEAQQQPQQPQETTSPASPPPSISPSSSATEDTARQEDGSAPDAADDDSAQATTAATAPSAADADPAPGLDTAQEPDHDDDDQAQAQALNPPTPARDEDDDNNNNDSKNDEEDDKDAAASSKKPSAAADSDDPAEPAAQKQPSPPAEKAEKEVGGEDEAAVPVPAAAADPDKKE